MAGVNFFISRFLISQQAWFRLIGVAFLRLFLPGDIDEDTFLESLPNPEGRLGREINYTMYGPEEFKRKKKEGNGFINTKTLNALQTGRAIYDAVLIRLPKEARPWGPGACCAY